METAQNCVRLAGLAEDITAYALLCDAADTKMRSGKLVRDVVISTPYPSPVGAPGCDGPAELCTVSLKLFLPWCATVRVNAGQGVSTREGRPDAQIRAFVQSLVRGRVVKHPRGDATWIVHRTAFNSTARRDLASGIGPSTVIEHMALSDDEMNDPTIPDDLKVTRSRIPRRALIPFTQACTCLANATIGGGHGSRTRSRTRDIRFGNIFEIAESFHDTSESDSGKRQLKACVAMQLFPELSRFCLISTDKVLRRCAYNLDNEHVDVRLPELAVNVFTRDLRPGKGFRWLNSLTPPRSSLYKYALGTGALTGGEAWALTGMCGFWNPAIGAASYGGDEFGAFLTGLRERDFHRTLFAGPAPFRGASRGKASKDGAVSQLPLSILSEEQYRTYLRASPCKDKIKMDGSLHVPAIAIAVGRCVPEVRRLCQDLLDGKYQDELRRVLSSESALRSFGAYVEHAASHNHAEVVMLNMTRHILQTGFGAVPLAKMLVDQSEVDEATWDAGGVPTFVSHLVCILTRNLHGVLHSHDARDKKFLDDVVPKVLLPIATFCLKWGETRTASVEDVPPAYSGGLPPGYGLGNEYDFAPEALRGGRQLSNAAVRYWVDVVNKSDPDLLSLQAKVAEEVLLQQATYILPDSHVSGGVRCDETESAEGVRAPSCSEDAGHLASEGNVIPGSVTVEDARSAEPGPTATARAPSRPDDDTCTGPEGIAILDPIESVTVDAVNMLRPDETITVGSDTDPEASCAVRARTTSTLAVRREHMRCHLGDRDSDSTEYTSTNCFLSRVLTQDWESYGIFIAETARRAPLSAIRVGMCYENPSETVQHVASLAWAEATAEVYERLKMCDEVRTETGMYRNSKDAFFGTLKERSSRVTPTVLCSHCRSLGNDFVDVKVDVGCQVTETPGWQGAQQRYRSTPERQQASTHTPARGFLSLRERMLAVVYTAKAGSKLVFAYVRAMSGGRDHRSAHCIIDKTAYNDLCRYSNESSLRMAALYDTTRVANMLQSFSGWQSDSTRACRVGGADGLPAFDVREKMLHSFDPILECLSNPSVFFRLREQCEAGDVPGPRGDWKGRWLLKFTQPSPPRVANLSKQTFDDDELWEMARWRRARVGVIDAVVRNIVQHMGLNRIQLEVVRDQQYVLLNVRKGKTFAERRIVFVKGGGGVGKSSLLGPLMSINLATNWNIGGHALSYENKGCGTNGGKVVVGLFAEMNRSLDASVAAVMRPGALRTADNKQSLAKIYRVGDRCEDNRVQVVTLGFLAEEPLHKLHPAWQRPAATVPAEEQTRFRTFLRLRTDYQRSVNPQTPQERYLHHKARENLHVYLLNSADIIASTLSAVSSWMFEGFEGTLHTVYVDECGKAPSPQLLYLLMGYIGATRVRNVVLIGDDNQIMPHSSTKETIPAAYTRRSLFEMVARAPNAHIFFLNIQYRMHPVISLFASSAFYGGKLQDGLSPAAFRRPYHADELNRFPLLLFLDTQGDATFAERRAERGVHPEEASRHYTDDNFPDVGKDDWVDRHDGSSESLSRANDGEAELCIAIAAALVRLYSCEGSGCSSDVRNGNPRLLIIAPYLAQKSCVESLVKREPVLQDGSWEISVLTAEAAQGEQADVVIVLTVRSQYDVVGGRTGKSRRLVEPTTLRARTRFVSQRNRLAVMCTRARYSLIFIGDSNLLESVEALEDYEKENGVESPWRRLIGHCKQNGVYEHATDAWAKYMKSGAVEGDRVRKKPRTRSP